MNRQTILAVLIGGLMLGMVAHPAVGELITFEFAGEVTSVQDYMGLLPDGVGVGSPFSGLYTFESTTPDSRPTVPNGGYYEDALAEVVGQVGGLGFVGPAGSGNSILVLNDHGPNGFDSYSGGCGVQFLGERMGFTLAFRDDTGAVFQDDSLPLSPPPRELVAPIGFVLSASSEDFFLRGEVTSFIPEPGTIMLVGLGALSVMKGRSGTAQKVDIAQGEMS